MVERTRLLSKLMIMGELHAEPSWITACGNTIRFQLIVSPRASRVTLKISPSRGLHIVVPKRFSPKHLTEILQEKERWILKTLHNMEEHRLMHPPKVFHEGMALSVLGTEKIVRYAVGGREGRPYVRETETELWIHQNSLSGSHKGTLEKHLRMKAKLYFVERTRQIAREMNVTYAKITVRAQKSRWGSCSKKKNLNFNWRLVMTPREVADYVIVHELAHTVHLNHSRNFYALVEQFCPSYKAYRVFLRKAQFGV